MPIWTHLSLPAFEKRFGDKKPEHWLVDGHLVEFSVSHLSDMEVSAHSYRFGGDWSRRPKPGVQEAGVKAGERVLLFSQDECIFKTNDDNSLGWRKEGVNNHRRKKHEGQGVMVSGFLPDFDTFLTFTDEEMAYLEDKHQESFTLTRSLPKLLGIKTVAWTSIATHQYGKIFDGYRDNAKIMQHVKEFLRCAKHRFRDDNVRILVLFDWSSGHAAVAENALVASRMGWKSGGKQPIMHEAIISDPYLNANDPSLRQLGSRQSMVFKTGEKPFDNGCSDADFTGIPKGIKQILWERGLLTPEMNFKGKLNNEGRLREETSGLKVMEAQSDFQWEPCALEEYIRGEGELCIFTPKFHSELNFIERAWGRAKWFLRLFCDYRFPGLKSRLGGLPRTDKNVRISSRFP